MRNGTAVGGARWGRAAVLATAFSFLPHIAWSDKPPDGNQAARSGVAAPIGNAPDGPGHGSPPDANGIAALLAAADDITHQVAGLRGLQPKRPIERGVLSRDEIGARLRERIAKEYTPDEIRVEARVLKRLGLLPPDADYQQLLLDLLMEQVAGFYDPFARKLYIADWLGLELQRPALAHEIEHALQDQHFDLKAFATPIKDDGDRQLARSALVEGDGTAAMLEFFAQSLGMDVGRIATLGDSLGKQLAAGMVSQSPVFTRAPRFLRETLLFPYFAGLNFVLALRKGQPWTKVDEAFRAPPDSTEQVLHPEKYFVRDRPAMVKTAPIAALAGARKELRRDVLGELELRVLLESRLPDGTAERAAEGWGGDRLVAYGEPEGDKPVTVIDLSGWDTEEDAKEMAAALRQFMARATGRDKGRNKDEDAAREPKAGGAEYASGGEAWFVERRGREVLAIFGAPPELRAAITDEVWAKWKVSYASPAAGGEPDKGRKKKGMKGKAPAKDG